LALQTLNPMTSRNSHYVSPAQRLWKNVNDWLMLMISLRPD
jgi:hypothetical protein